MKTKSLLSLAISLLFFSNCHAQKKVQETSGVTVNESNQGEVEPKKTVLTEECSKNLSLFNEFAKNRQFADAVVPWNAVYRECPGAHKAIYSRGKEILQWQLTQTKDAQEYDALFSQLMKLYDDRIVYFGNDDKYPTPWILGVKALDYVTYVKEDELKKPAYKWFLASIEGMGTKCELEVIRNFLILSRNIYKVEPLHAETFINDYLKVSNLLEQMVLSNDQKDFEAANQLISMLNEVLRVNSTYDLFASSATANSQSILSHPKINQASFFLQFKPRIEELFFVGNTAKCKDVKCVSAVVQNIVTDLNNVSSVRKANSVVKLKQSMDLLFMQSGVATCETLDSIYKDRIISSVSDFNQLSKIIQFYRLIKCTDSSVYFEASTLSHKMMPTLASAIGCAELALKKREFVKAIDFYLQAVKLSSNATEKSDLYYKIAQLYSNLDNYTKAREAARNAIENNSSHGKAYMLIGKLYASSPSVYDDAVLNKSIYWVAVDKFQKAKQVDPDCTAEANELIRKYSLYFPSKNDIFFKPELEEGKQFLVGGWIGEMTICR